MSGGTIGWLDKHIARGRPLSILPARTRTYVVRHAVFGRVLDPNPDLPLRIAVTLSTSRRGGKATGVCTWLVGAAGSGGGCAVRKQLFSTSPLTMGWSLDSGSNEFATVSGLASDDVARISAYLKTGQTQPVPLRDNTYIVQIARSQFPVRLVAYDSQNKVIGFTPAIQGFDGGGAAPARGRARLLKRVTTATGGWAELLTGPATGGGSCMYVRWYESKRATGVMVGCSHATQRSALALGPSGDPATLVTGRVRPDVATIELHYQDGTETAIRPIDGFAIYAVPRAHLAAGHQLTSATARSATGKSSRKRVIPSNDPEALKDRRRAARRKVCRRVDFQVPGTTRPDSYAATTACARSRRSSLRRTWLTCVFTVSLLSTRRSAISWFERPAATRLRISISRRVSTSRSSGRMRCGGRRRANSAIRRRVTTGARSASPAATTRTASNSVVGSERP